MPITITEFAAEQALEIIKDQFPEGDVALRLWVAGGGCAGLNYGLGIVSVDDKSDDDELSEDKGVKFLVDKMSLDYVDGSEIDWDETPLGGGFKVQNPNASSTCGCNNSFTVEGDDTLPSGCGGCAHNTSE